MQNVQIAWVLTGLSIGSIGIALLYYTFKRRERHYALVALGMLLLASGAVSLIQGLPFLPDIDARVLVSLFVPIAVLCGIAAWPIAVQALRLPNHRQLLEYSRELEKARDAALETESLKRGFLSNIRHELRTPLTGIIGMNELLLLGELSDEQRLLGQTVHGSAESLLVLINELLDLSNVDAGDFAVRSQPMNPVNVVTQCVQLMASAASDKGLQLETDIDPRCNFIAFGDALRLRQVLINLLDNAIRFTSAGSVSLSVVLVSEDEKQAYVRFVVADSGMGISESEQKHLFEPFWQRDMSATRKHGGPGLGLPIAKHFVSAMGGDEVNVRSRVGVGSSFSFVLPFPRHKGLSMPLPPVSVAPIVIVTSNGILRSILHRHLELLDFPHIAIESLGSASASQINGAIVMLLDQASLDAETEQIIDELRRRRSESGRGPIIVGMAAQGPRVVAPQFDDVMTKPVSMHQLWRVMQKWFWPSQTA